MSSSPAYSCERYQGGSRVLVWPGLRFRFRPEKLKIKIRVEENFPHLSQPADAGLDIRLHLVNNVEELHIVDVIDGVVSTEDPQVLLDPVVHKSPLELSPVCLYHREQLVFPEQENVKYGWYRNMWVVESKKIPTLLLW